MTNEIKFADTVILVDVAYVDTVSYTHLDVYKRQIRGRSVRSISNPSPDM